MFRDVPPRPDFLALEHEVQALWENERVFDKLREQTRGGPKWSFLDGPITANNPMGVHHGWGRTYKDLYNRYRAMRGHELRWQQGFDCQGLWVEVAVEKELGFTSKRQIEQYGIAAFVNQCKQRVYHYADVISRQSQRLGYWMDWDNSYYTLSDENNYGIWGFLKHCHSQGWLYRGHDVMPWCPRCGTALSEHEIATEGYAELTHLALTVAFPLLARPGEALLAWTTTPWTLPANVALAVHPELTYVRVSLGGRPPTEDDHVTSYWLAKDRLELLASSTVYRLPSSAVLEERQGAELVGWRYSGPFDDLPAQRGVAHQVVAWDEVSADEGSGVVHIAPGAGKEDYALGHALGLAVLAPLDDDGVYVDGYGWLTGHKASAVAEAVAAALAQAGRLFAREHYTHRYPVCWRCGTELVFRLVDEWLIRMDELRHQMMVAARQARWIPAFGLERELDWLRSMDDWMISKKRYWGLALPFYPCSCGHVTVVGSKEELHSRAVTGWQAFAGHSPHRPWVDAVQIACEHCGAPTARVPDVGNVWLDAGIVAFSTLRYQQDRAYWAEWFPTDLVVESFPGQFRNWFYALLAMSSALDGRSPFKTLLGHALVKDSQGEEMHKSKGNSILFEDAADWLGVEPLRWLFAGAALERNMHFGRELVEEAKRSLQPLWEVYRFFVLYANAEAVQSYHENHEDHEERSYPKSSFVPFVVNPFYPNREQVPAGLQLTNAHNHQSSMDAWLLARLDQLVTSAREWLDTYDVRSFTQEVALFLDDLSNWYVRRSRRRFWGVGQSPGAQQAAFATLHTTLVTLARLLAPVLPFLAEALYQNLVRSVDPQAPVSVHLTGYPTATDQRPTINDQRPTTNDERPTTNDQRPTTDDDRPTVGDDRPTADDRRTTNDGKSVGNDLPPAVGRWPLVDNQHTEREILHSMALVRQVVALGRVARKAAGVRVRQPLARMLVIVERPSQRAALEQLGDEVLDELNIKRLELVDAPDALVAYRLKPNLRLLGPRLGKQLTALRAALEQLPAEQAGALARQVLAGQPVTLVLGDTTLTLDATEVLVETTPLPGLAVAQEGGLQVALDTTTTPALQREGQARDLVRLVQEARKAARLDPRDRVVLYLLPAGPLGELLAEWGGYLATETLAERLVFGEVPAGAHQQRVTLDGLDVVIGLHVAG